MKSSKTTRRALLGSLTSLVLCFAMLIGSTFAWFTDSASTSVNTIQAGTLDVQLLDAQGNSLEGQTLSWQKATDGAQQEVLWEPGCTYNLQTITIKNNGNLALKYKVAITGINGSAKLNEVIDWTISNSGTAIVEGGDEYSLSAGASNTLTISGTMQTTANNEYQGLTIDGIAITVYATQVNSEYDSTTKDYDAGAEYLIPWDGSGADSTDVPAANPTDNKIHISTAAELMALMNTTTAYGANNVIVLDKSIDLGGQTVKGIGADGAAFFATFDGQGNTISNFKIEQTRGYYAGLFSQVSSGATVENLTVANATIKGTGTSMVGAVVAGTDGATIENCKAVNCTVIGLKKVGGVVGYASAATVRNCSAENCIVSTTSAVESVQAQIGKVLGFENAGCTVSGLTDNNVTLIQGASDATVVASGVTQSGSTYYISSAAGLNWFNDQINKSHNNFNNKTLKLTADIDYKGATWLPAGQNFATDDPSVAGYANTVEFHGTFDGNGKTISNIKIAGLSDTQVNGLSTAGSNGGQQQVYSVAFIGYASGATIKNLTIKDVTVTGSHYVAAIVGMTDAGASVENCHVENATITCKHINETQCGDKAGGIVGNLNSSVSGCSVKNSTISAGRDAGQVVGCAQSGSSVATDCTATNVTVSAGTGCTGTNINNAIIGRDLRS